MINVKYAKKLNSLFTVANIGNQSVFLIMSNIIQLPEYSWLTHIIENTMIKGNDTLDTKIAKVINYFVAWFELWHIMENDDKLSVQYRKLIKHLNTRWLKQNRLHSIPASESFEAGIYRLIFDTDYMDALANYKAEVIVIALLEIEFNPIFSHNALITNFIVRLVLRDEELSDQLIVSYMRIIPAFIDINRVDKAVFIDQYLAEYGLDNLILSDYSQIKDYVNKLITVGAVDSVDSLLVHGFLFNDDDLPITLLVNPDTSCEIVHRILCSHGIYENKERLNDIVNRVIMKLNELEHVVRLTKMTVLKSLLIMGANPTLPIDPELKGFWYNVITYHGIELLRTRVISEDSEIEIEQFGL
jgi:hypothetical protein